MSHVLPPWWMTWRHLNALPFKPPLKDYKLNSPTSYSQDLATVGGTLSETSGPVRPAVKGFLSKPAMLPVDFQPPGDRSLGWRRYKCSTRVGLLVSMFSDIFVNEMPAIPTINASKTETEGDATTDMSMEMGRGEDGSSKFALGLKSEASKEKTSAKTEMSAKVDGQRCPNAEGQVSFTIKATLGSSSGGTGTTQDLTTFVRATVGDDGEITGTTFDLSKAPGRSREGARFTLRQE